MNEEAFLALIAFILSAILAICKLTFWSSLTWFWVLVPLMIIGAVCFCFHGDIW